MPAPSAGTAARWSRRSRFVTPAGPSRRGELAAALAVAAVLAELLLAQVTLVLTAVFLATGRISRWRPHWLAVAAVAGSLWALAVGPGRAAAGFIAGPRRITGYLAGAYGDPGRLAHLPAAFAGLGRWLPGQLPLALITAAAQTAGLTWLGRRRPGWLPWLGPPDSGQPPGPGRVPDLGWMPGSDQAPGSGWAPGSDRGPGSGWARAPGRAAALGQSARPGLIAGVRRRYTAAVIRSGGVVTPGGGCVGLDLTTGRRAEVTWAEAGHGVLCAGPDPAAVAQTGFQLAWAAIRRRKSVFVLDLAGSPWLAGSVAAACASSGAPLLRYGESGPDPAGCYDPVRGGDPARDASLILAMTDGTGLDGPRRQAWADWLGCVLAVSATGQDGRALPVLDELAGLLEPGALAVRAARIPAWHPDRDALVRRAGQVSDSFAADPAAISAVAGQLLRLRRSALGHWLRRAAGPARGEQAIELGRAMRERAVVLFSLDRGRHGRPAGMIARLAAADLVMLLADFQQLAARCDSLIWVNGCEVLPGPQADELMALGSVTGAVTVLGTGSAGLAASLAARAGVLAVRGPADPAVARCFAELAGRAAPGPVSAGRTVWPPVPGPGRPGWTAAGPGPAPAAGPAGFAGAGWPDGGGLYPAAAGAADPFLLDGEQAGLTGLLVRRGPDGLALLVRGPQRRLLASCRAIPAGGAR